jgi:hypothetical protein
MVPRVSLHAAALSSHRLPSPTEHRAGDPRQQPRPNTNRALEIIMTNNTLKSTIETIVATNALIVVTLDGTFNSLTGAPVLSARTRPDQRNAFLKQYTERVNSEESKAAHSILVSQKIAATEDAKKALADGNYAESIKHTQRILEIVEQLDQPRMYYRVKPNVDLRTVAEKRAAKKAENAAKKATKQAEKEAAAASKMANKVEGETKPETSHEAAPKSGKSGKKA